MILMDNRKGLCGGYRVSGIPTALHPGVRKIQAEKLKLSEASYHCKACNAFVRAEEFESKEKNSATTWRIDSAK
jgi:hypothetical protein